MIDKKKTLLISAAGVLMFLIFLFPKDTGLCVLVSFSCSAIFDQFAENLIPILPLFMISIIIYKMRDDVYQAWFRFARWWIPLSMLAIFLSPEYGGNWMYSLEKGSVAFFFSLIFLVISIILIIYKHFSPLGSPTSK